MSQNRSPEKKNSLTSLAVALLLENGAILFGIAVFGAMFYMLIGSLFDHTLYQNYPYPYFAGDQSVYLAITDAALNQGHFLYQPGYLSDGQERVIPVNGPGVAHLPALVTTLLGIETFNAVPLAFGMIFLLLPFIFLGGLQAGPEIKLLSFSFLPLLLTFNFVIGYLWGQYGSILGTFFLFLVFLIYPENKFRRPIPFGVVLTVIALSHFPELLFLAIYLAISLAWDFFGSRTPLTVKGITGFAKKYGWLMCGFFVFLLLSSFFLVLFYYGNVKTLLSPSSFRLESVKPSEFTLLKTVPFENFRTEFQALILAGAVVLFFSTKGIGASFKITMLSVALFTNFNYIGLIPSAAYRAFQQRFFWPFTLAPFAAITIFFIVQAASRRVGVSPRYRWLVLAAIFVAMLTVSMQSYRQIQGPGVMTKDQFDAMRFLEKYDTKGDILFLYGGGYDQVNIGMKKLHYQTKLDQMLNSLKEGHIGTEPMLLERMALPMNTPKAFFNGTQISIREFPQPNRSICDFRYYIFDRFTFYNNPLIGYNKLFVDSIDQTAFRVIYNNVQAVILENTGGKECLRSENR